jgi:hypothetical protein
MPFPNYNINFQNMVSMFLGNTHRKPVRISWLTALLKAVSNLHSEFLAYSNTTKNEIKWNGQTIKLEKLLQEKFGAGITITNNSQTADGMFIGTGEDVKAFWGENPDVRNYFASSYTIASTNFTVNVPAAIVFTQSVMEAYINKYKLHGTTYNIVII